MASSLASRAKSSRAASSATPSPAARRGPDLNVDLIAKTALAVADEQGADGFTLRAVADALGVTPMALYHHVADKTALVSLVVDASLASRPLPAPTGVWQDDLWELARWTRQIMVDHPAVGKLRQIYRVWTPSAFPIAERWLSVWQQSGLPLDKAVTAAVVTSLALTGIVAEEPVIRQMDLPDESMLAMFPNARLVFTAERDIDADFELVARALIEGVHARLQRQIDAAPASSSKPKID
jgi:AcrR family transcriptional regulator